MTPDLSPGARLGQYEIVDHLGTGGMGTVYRAADTKLGRQVALKLLHPKILEDGTAGIARFEREARALAALNHPRVAAIYGFEQQDGVPFLVLEYVPGTTLAERLRRGPLPLKEAVSLGKQIAEGLEAAHARNLIHRDLKPANIKIGDNGQVKVLDFGLAKSVEKPREVSSESPTATLQDLTQKMEAVGTPAYMSPEQACGKELDTRTDIWSFGCVLYEALSGKQAFRGKTITEIVAAVVEREPDWAALPAVTPASLRLLLQRCLRKDPTARLRDMGDARIELEDFTASTQELPSQMPFLTGRTAGGQRRTILAAALAGAVLGVLGLQAWVRNRAGTVAPPVVRLSFETPKGREFNPTWNSVLTISPDGRTIAFGARATGTMAGTMFLRSLDKLEAEPLSDGSGLSQPMFSPDSRNLLVVQASTQTIKKVALTGGAPVTLANADFHFRGDWGDDNYYYWTDGYFGPIIRTPIAGGESQPVTKLDLDRGERAHRHAHFLPGGKSILFTVSSGGMDSFNDARIEAFSLNSTKRKTLLEGGFSAKYSPSGHLVYARAGSLYAVPFDLKTLEVTGSPVKVVENVFMSTNSGSAYFDISRTGTLVYASGPTEGGDRTLVWVDRQGKTTALPLPARSYLFPRISHSGKLIAFEVEGVNHDFYVHDPARGVTTKMSTDGVSHAPVWTPDDSHIAFRSWKAGTMTMWWMPTDRSGPEERLTTIGARQSLVAFTPDGSHASFTQMEPGTPFASDIWILPIHGDRKPQPFVKSKFMKGSGRFSPDGKWVVYCSAESGRPEVYVQPWPGPGPKTQVSSDGGFDPIWSRDGKELFYRYGDKMMVVAVAMHSTFNASRPHVLWEGHYAVGMGSSCGTPGATSASYDVTADGQRFLMVKDTDQDAISTRVVVVVNFAEELKRLDKERK